VPLKLILPSQVLRCFDKRHWLGENYAIAVIMLAADLSSFYQLILFQLENQASRILLVFIFLGILNVLFHQQGLPKQPADQRTFARMRQNFSKQNGIAAATV